MTPVGGKVGGNLVVVCGKDGGEDDEVVERFEFCFFRKTYTTFIYFKCKKRREKEMLVDLVLILVVINGI